MIFTVSKKNNNAVGSILVRDNGDIERTTVNEDGTETKAIIKNEVHEQT